MSFGRMTEFIDIIEIVREKDAEGFAGAPEEKVILSTRAYFEAQRGTKVWANRAAFSTATAMFTFRDDPAVKVTPSGMCHNRTSKRNPSNQGFVALVHFKCNDYQKKEEVDL